MGGAQPLAATMNGALFLGVEVDPARIEKRLKSGYCDKIAWSLDEALKLIDQARKDRKSLSVGLVGNCADVLPEIVKRGVVPDVLTDQTSAHDALNGYVPHGMSLEDALALRRTNPDEYIERAMRSMAVHIEAMLALQKKGAVAFDYGNEGLEWPPRRPTGRTPEMRPRRLRITRTSERPELEEWQSHAGGSNKSRRPAVAVRFGGSL